EKGLSTSRQIAIPPPRSHAGLMRCRQIAVDDHWASSLTSDHGNRAPPANTAYRPHRRQRHSRLDREQTIS
ncbi:hypothetical protein E2562_026079, partial [Oryza meyeriana var. granulata]